MSTRENGERGDVDREVVEDRAAAAAEVLLRHGRCARLVDGEGEALAAIAGQVPALNADLDAVYRAAAALRAAVARVRAWLDDNAHMMRPEDVRALVDALEVGHG